MKKQAEKSLAVEAELSAFKKANEVMSRALKKEKSIGRIGHLVKVFTG